MVTNLFRGVSEDASGTRASFLLSVQAVARNVSQLVAMVKDMISDCSIDGNRAEEAKPNWDIVRIESDKAPVRTDPAPQLSNFPQ